MIAPLGVALVRVVDRLLQGAWVFPWGWKNWKSHWGRCPWRTETFEESEPKENPAESSPELFYEELCPLHA